MSNKTIYFMAGLPRSGSTLLQSILNQNPRIHTEPSSPLLELVRSAPQMLNKSEHFRAYPKPKAALALPQHLFNWYYQDTEKPIVIDKNRGWPTLIQDMEKSLGSKVKIICPVRDVDEILASFLKIAHANPFNPQTGRLNFIDHSLVALNRPINDNNRCEFLLSDHGLIGQSLTALKKAVKDGLSDRLLFVEYGDLAEDPEFALGMVYDFLEEEPYQKHNFEKIQNPFQPKDSEVFGVSTLHAVESKISFSLTDPEKILPWNFLKISEGKNFWRNLE